MWDCWARMIWHISSTASLKRVSSFPRTRISWQWRRPERNMRDWFCCQHGSRSIGQMIRGLELIWEVYEPDEMPNHIEFI
jgi:hypothetical protein